MTDNKNVARVTISSDGMPKTTRIVHADGSEVHGVSSVRWSIEVGKPATALLELRVVAVRVAGIPVFEISHPTTGEMMRVRSIVTPDGRTIDLDERQAGTNKAGTA